MLKPQILASDNVRSLFITGSFIIASGETKLLPVRSIPTPPLHKARRAGRIFAISSKPTRTLNVEEKDISVKAKVTVKLTVGGLLSDIGVNRGIDDFTDLLGKSLLLELISSELDPKTGSEKELVKAYAHKIGKNEGTVTYEGDFKVKVGFGEVGGVYVTNMHHKAMHLLDIVITGFPNGPVNISCNSWIHPVDEGKPKRIFFTSKSYLPEDTPKGLLRLRAEELEVLRGNGQGERKRGERIYDYDTYNDLGNPDKSIDLARPVLGGPNHPYPRRCRTGRPRTRKDPSSESRVDKVYVPRDEEFSEVKQIDFSAKTLKSLLHSLIPSLETSVVDKKLGFPYFTAIDSLFNEGVSLQNVKGKGIFQLLLPRLVKAIADGGDDLLLFEIPQIIDRDKFSWFRDEEFGRQTLAGLNPFSIQLVTEFPFVSKLDPKIYGSPDSLITKEIIEREIKGIMTAEEAIKQKKIFVLDYHDIFLPYVHKVRQLEETTLYGSRTVFFLTHVGTLMPIAIELTRPKSPTVPQWRQVFTPGIDATSCWLWKLAKCHVCAHDSGYHQLVVHWLRTHCCVEPYIIAARRQLSEMHPICRLLHPHFRYTMEINALARESLINAGGIIENCFAPGKYSIELSSVAYDKFWRFDMESLPADLIRRGMAVEDPDSEYGIKLTIEDYPFANDGLLLWSEIKQWVTDYVTHYYSDDNKVANDNELQSWWTEVRTKGHADKKNEPWWPVINSIDSLIQVLSTIIWITSGHHAAVNFGQYPYAGYFPNRPTICRSNMPVEKGENEAFQRFLRKPESVLLECFPSQIQATRVMSILDVLSSHSPEEEYIGTSAEISWADEPVINAAFERFCGKMKEMEGIIDQRNTDLNLRNRTGAGVLSYELLKPFSKPGVTGMGVPNSISI